MFQQRLSSSDEELSSPPSQNTDEGHCSPYQNPDDFLSSDDSSEDGESDADDIDLYDPKLLQRDYHIK